MSTKHLDASKFIYLLSILPKMGCIKGYTQPVRGAPQHKTYIDIHSYRDTNKNQKINNKYKKDKLLNKI